MKDLTSYVYSFEEMIQGNFLYVDKTEYIWQLIRPAKAMYFLSRPRRFGKSLTLSTLKAVFEGKKELFKGLAGCASWGIRTSRTGRPCFSWRGASS